MELKIPSLERAKTKDLNMPQIKTRIEDFCEYCRQHSIKWGFCYICGLEIR